MSTSPFDAQSLAAVSPWTAVAVAPVLFASGFVSGLSGFAFSAVASPILWLLPPQNAVPLIMLLSICNQLVSAGRLRREMRLLPGPEGEGALPYIAGGVLGAPLGVYVLKHAPAAQLAAGFGGFLAIYSLVSLLRPDRATIPAAGWRAAVAVGAAGGVVGGFTAFPGALPVLWLSLRGVGKSAARGVTQPYILALQTVALVGVAVVAPQVFDTKFWMLWLTAAPFAILGSLAGVGMYKRMSDVDFRKAVLVFLAISGASLLVKSAWR